MKQFISLQGLINLDTIKKLIKVVNFSIAMLKIFWEEKHNKIFQPGGLLRESEIKNSELSIPLKILVQKDKFQDLNLLEVINSTSRRFHRNLQDLN